MLFLLRSLRMSERNINAGFILAALTHAKTSALERRKRHTIRDACILLDGGTAERGPALSLLEDVKWD